MDKKIAKILVGLPLEGPFDYKIPPKIAKDIQIGCRVWVQFGFRKLVGYVVDFSPASKFKKIRPIISLVDRQPVLSQNMLRFTKDFAEYYCCTWSEAIETSLPVGIRKGRAVSLNKNAETALPSAQFNACLIHDFLKEKYWELIAERIKNTLKEKSSVLFLVPDAITLKNTEELIRRSFNCRFTVLDRKKGAKVQLLEWQKIKNGEIDIVLGTRSAVFAPLVNLGLIIVEDEDSSIYKQEQGPFYHGREAAIMRCRLEKIPLVLTSQTPSLEAVHLIQSSKFKLIRPESKTVLPKAQIVDLSLYRRKKDRLAIFSLPLLDILQQTLGKAGKTILFINRKGFSTAMRCKKCGFSLKCPRCNVSLTFHYDQHKLICRYCHYKTEPVELCPQCNSDYIRYFGMGTEKIESEAHRIFPTKKIMRLDSEKKNIPANFDLLIATQKILNIPAPPMAEVVAVLQIDATLNRLDFRAAEKTFFLLVSLLKLAKDKLVIQTHNREHYAIQTASNADFDSFYKKELRLRRSLGFPPFSHFVSIGLRGRSEEKVKIAANSLSEVLNKLKSKSIEIFETQPDIPAKLRGNFRCCILLKGRKIAELNRLIKKGIKDFKKKSGIIISVNVDT